MFWIAYSQFLSSGNERPTLWVCPRKLRLEILLVHLWQGSDVKDCLKYISFNFYLFINLFILVFYLHQWQEKHKIPQMEGTEIWEFWLRTNLINFVTSSLVILLRVSLVGVPQSLRTLVIWSISEICHNWSFLISESLLREGFFPEKRFFLTIISWKESSPSHQLCHDAPDGPDVNWNKKV